jgi:protein phosphatase 1G
MTVILVRFKTPGACQVRASNVPPPPIRQDAAASQAAGSQAAAASQAAGSQAAAGH